MTDRTQRADRSPGALRATGLEADRVPSILRNLTAVAAAVLDLDGACLDANLGFALLLDRDALPSAAEPVAQWFQQPSFRALREATAQGEPYAGLLSFGDGVRFLRTVRGEVQRRADRLLLLAEYDIADLERLAASVTHLNERLAEAQRELVRANRQLRRDKDEIRRLMLTDPLTGAANRRSFDERCRAELEAGGDDARLGVVVADIDRFKSVNDTYGHAAGDTALVAFVAVMQQNTRDGDLVARLGGEEFCVLLPRNCIEEAMGVAERIRSAFHDTPIEGIDGRLSASFGVACRRPGQDLDDLLRLADQALYRAKADGRNRVVAAMTPA
jgi:diguanylate cyclase (GGDEF)-like protein